MRKHWISLVAMALCLTMLCGSVALAATPDEGLEPMTINWWTPRASSPGVNEDEDRVIAAMNDLIHQYLPNTTLNPIIVDVSEAGEKWKLAMASGKDIDFASPGGVISLSDAVAADQFLDITDVLNTYGQDLLRDLPQRCIDLCTYGDKIYAISIYYYDTCQMNPTLYVPTALLTGYADPDDWRKVFYEDEFRWTEACYGVIGDWLAKIYADGKIQEGVSPATLYFIIRSGNRYNLINDEFGISWNDPDFTVNYCCSNDDAKLFCQTMTDWYRAGYIRSDILSMENNRVYENAEGGNVIWSHYGDNYYSARERTEMFGFDITGITTFKNYTSYGFTAGGYYAIPYTCKDTARTMMMLNVLAANTGLDIMNMYCYGLEGEHYELLDRENRLIRQFRNDKDEVLYYNFATFNNYELFITQANSIETMKWAKEVKCANALGNPLPTYKPDHSAYATEIAQVKAVQAEYNYLFFGCANDFEAEWAEYTAKLEASGLNAILEGMQAQVDAYIAEHNITGW